MNMFRRLLLSLTLTGCAGDFVYHGDLSFSAEERAQIEQAADLMAARTGGGRIEISWDGELGDPVHNHRILRAVPEKTAAAWGELKGEYGPGYTFYVSPETPKGMVGMVMAHELGHWYGMPHHYGYGLMNPWGGQWSQADVDLCHSVHQCEGIQ